MPMLALNATVEDLEGTWLEIRCCHGIGTYLPMSLVGRTSWRRIRLRDVISRRRCKACLGPPHSVALVESPAGLGSGGPPPGWVIKLA